MKKLIYPLTILILSLYTSEKGTCQVSRETNKKKGELILMSYNVRNCHGLDEKTDYQRIADIISRVSPMVIAVQELDSATERSNGVVALKELADRTGMYSLYGPTIDYLGGKYGNGILSKEKPISWKSVPLPGREEKRAILIVELPDFIFCCTHFSLNQEDRLSSVDIINELFPDSSKPVFLAGDMNALPESDVIKTLETKWTMINSPTNFTIPSDYPKRCIDYIFIAKNSLNQFKVLATAVEKETIASDHRPVWVKLKKVK